MESTKKSSLQILLIGLKLLLICAIVAGVVSLVYTVTEKAYQDNMQQQKQLAMESIFHPGVTAVELQGTYGTEIPVYRIEENGTVLGWCAEITTAGYGGDMQLMVGYLSDGTILNVAVVSHSETPGLGDKITQDDYRSQYTGKSGTLTLGEDIDAISGATYSSRYVMEGVNKATAVIADCIAKEATK